MGSGLAIAGFAVSGLAADAPAARGAKVYGQYCAACHGQNMTKPQSFAIDLRKFPADQHDRFIRSVLNGKGAMPAWKGAVTPAQAEELWAYVSAAAKPATAKK
ncbi:c-type cytochrome [Sphingomonas sp.]|uniref:c-type cytochrome n=1 Tax=Sphingomonas sp. TaxID=28214 RepID=UPI0035BC6211